MSTKDIIKSLKFRSYMFKVITVILGILNSYNVIDNNHINLFYVGAFVVTAIASADLSDASDHIDTIDKKGDHHGSHHRRNR